MRLVLASASSSARVEGPLAEARWVVDLRYHRPSQSRREVEHLGLFPRCDPALVFDCGGPHELFPAQSHAYRTRCLGGFAIGVRIRQPEQQPQHPREPGPAAEAVKAGDATESGATNDAGGGDPGDGGSGVPGRADEGHGDGRTETAEGVAGVAAEEVEDGVTDYTGPGRPVPATGLPEIGPPKRVMLLPEVHPRWVSVPVVGVCDSGLFVASGGAGDSCFL